VGGLRLTYVVPGWDLLAGAEKAARSISTWLAKHHFVTVLTQRNPRRALAAGDAVVQRLVHRPKRNDITSTSPDVVLVQHGMVVPVLRWGLRCPVGVLVHTLHDVEAVFRARLADRVSFWCFNSGFSYRHGLAAARRRNESLGLFSICQPGFDPSEWVPGEGSRIGLVNAAHGKGIHRLLALAKKFPGRGFLVVRGEWGDQVVDRSAPNVQWFGEQEDMRFVYAQMDALLLPSHEETFGLAGVEAQASGCAVFASNLPALRETLGAGAVYLPPRGGLEKWVKAIRAYKGERRSELRRAALQNVTRFNLDQELQPLNSLLQTVTRYGSSLGSPKLGSTPVDLCVVITTYNRPHNLLRLLQDIEEQAGSSGFKIKVKVYDDRSKESYDPVRPLLARNPEWEFTQAPIHHGKPNFWRWNNRIYKAQAEENADHFLFLPDDVRLCERFFVRILEEWERIHDPDKVTLNPLVSTGRVTGPCWTGVPPTPVGSVVQTQWVDGLFLCDRRYLEELEFTVRPIKGDWKKHPGVASGVGEQISTRLHRKGLGMYRTEQSLVVHVDVPSQMNPAVRKKEPQTAVNYVDGQAAHDRLVAAARS